MYNRIEDSYKDQGVKKPMIELEIQAQKSDTKNMDSGQILFVTSRLILGALASFFAIMLWSKTRDTAWMLVVIGTIAGYVDIVYSILDLFGITRGDNLLIGSVPAAAIILPSLRISFFIAAFTIMVIRLYRHHTKS
jgi:hypothetical protein